MTPARTTDNPPPPGVDPTRPSIARAYDAALGGKDNYEIDRQVVREITAAAPAVFDMAWANRNFLIRVVRFLAHQAEIDQFIDCGSGLPTAENTHQVVQRINPRARVVYVDNDPDVLTHGGALLKSAGHAFMAAADIFQPSEVLGHELVRTHLDLTKPVALLQISTLHHHVGDRGRPAEIMKEYVDALAAGSFVAVAHFTDPENEYTPTARNLEKAFKEGPLGSGTFRTIAEIEALFPGLEMIPPGVVPCVKWWPDGPPVKPPTEADYLVAGGVGRKP